MNDRLYRSRDERMFAGVAGGVAERFDLDPSLVRIVWVILMVASGSLFFWLYVVMAIVVPEAPSTTDRWAAWTTATESGPGAVPGWTAPGSSGPTPDPTSGAGAAAAFAATEPPSASSDEPTELAPTGEGSALPDVAAPGEPAPAVAASGSAAPTDTSPPPQGSWPASPPPPPQQWGGGPPPEVHRRRRRGSGGVIGGLVLILLGGYFLLRTAAPQIDLGPLWPVILVVIGIALVIGSFRPGRDGDGSD